MSKLKYCFVAYGLFQDLLTVKPMMTGCYQWIRVFDGDAKNYKQLDDPEKYDVIQVNLDGYDWRIVHHLKERLRGSSTKVVANQDYAPETYKDSFEHFQDFQIAMRDADFTFATTPSAQESMQILCGDKQKVHMIPHPCETHVLKHVGTTKKYDKCAVIFHRYFNDTITPWIIMQNLGIDYVLAAYYKQYDKWKRRTNSMYPQLVGFLKFPDFMKFLKEMKMGLFMPLSWTYGRVVCDAAALGVPMVASSTVYSSRVLFPLTSVYPMEYDQARDRLIRLQRDDTFYQEVVDIAKYNVEYFGHKQSKERYMAMLESK